jgi:hypothetical protein
MPASRPGSPQAVATARPAPFDAPVAYSRSGSTQSPSSTASSSAPRKRTSASPPSSPGSAHPRSGRFDSGVTTMNPRATPAVAIPLNASCEAALPPNPWRLSTTGAGAVRRGGMLRWYVRSAPSTSSVCGPSVSVAFGHADASSSALQAAEAPAISATATRRPRSDRRRIGELRGLVELDEVAGRIGEEGLAPRPHR